MQVGDQESLLALWAGREGWLEAAVETDQRDGGEGGSGSEETPSTFLSLLPLAHTLRIEIIT